MLAGGRARRLGGVHKPSLEVGGRAVLRRVLDAVPDASRHVIVGPSPGVPEEVVVLSEDPPGSGPVPAVATALREVTASWVALLAGDIPFLRPADVAELREAAGSGDGAVLLDDRGREQWLIGVWRAATLRRALRDYQGSSLRGLLAPLVTTHVRPSPAADTPPPWLDCDTWADLEAARGWTCTR